MRLGYYGVIEAKENLASITPLPSLNYPKFELISQLSFAKVGSNGDTSLSPITPQLRPTCQTHKKVNVG